MTYTEHCNRCRFWHEDMAVRDPADVNFGFGHCRRRPPVVIDSVVSALLPKLEYGQQADPEIGTASMSNASLWPVTFAMSWCGDFDSLILPRPSPCAALSARETIND